MDKIGSAMGIEWGDEQAGCGIEGLAAKFAEWVEAKEAEVRVQEGEKAALRDVNGKLTKMLE